MPMRSAKRSLLWMGLLAISLLILGVLPVLAAPNTTTKILFIQGNTSADLGAYKTFLTNTVYPGQTMVFSGDTLADKYAFATTAQSGILNPAQLARVNDADLIIFTPDISYTDYLTPNWNPTYAPTDWNAINVPMIVHNAYLPTDGALQNSTNVGQWGWNEQWNNDITLSYGPAVGAPTGAACVGSSPNNWHQTLYQTDPYFTGSGMTFYAGTNTTTWIQLVTGNTAYPMGAVTINRNSSNGGTELASGNPANGYMVITRFAQDAQFYQAYRKAGSRRMYFGMGARTNYNAANSFLNDPVNGATADGKRALTSALTYLYNPANGRRPVPYAGANIRVNILTGQPSVNYTVADATYSDGEGGTVGTLQWSLQALDSRNEGSETIASGGTTTTPQFTFTKKGTYVATLKATKVNLDYVISQKTITVGGASVPYIAAITPQPGRMVATSPLGIVTVTFDHNIAFTAPLQLTVTGGTPTPSTVNGTTADNTTFSFDCTGIALSGVNTQIGLSLNTSTVTDGIGGTLAFPTATYVWGYVYNAAGSRPIVLCSNRTAASDNAYKTLLTNLYGAGTPITIWNQVNYNAATWSAATSATLQNAALVIFDSSEGLNYGQWNALRAPLLIEGAYLPTQANINMAPNRNNWGSTWRGMNTENYSDNPFFEGVALRGDGVIRIFGADQGNYDFLTYNSGSANPTNTYTSTPNGIAMGNYGLSGEASKHLVYWPPNTPYHTGTTNKAAGRRMYASLSGGNSSPNLWTTNVISTADGIKFAQNLHKYFAQPTGSPNVVWKDMDTQVWHKLTSVTVRFDRAITMPGALTIKDASNTTIYTTGAPTTSDTLAFRYTIPAATWIGKGSQTLNFSIDMTANGGVKETESGYNLPYQGGSTYAWQSYYDTAKLRVHIGVLDKGREDYDMYAYTNLLQSVYGPSTWVEWLENTTDAYAAGVAPWSAQFVTRLNACDMLIIGANQTSTYFGATYWTANGGVAAWTKPIITTAAGIYGGTAPSTPTNANWTNVTAGGNATDNVNQITKLNATSPLFNGMDFTTVPGKSTILTVSGYPGDVSGGIQRVSGTASAMTLAGQLAATSTAANDVTAAYVQAGSLLYTGTGSAVTHAGARAFCGPATVDSVQLLTADGKTLVRNMLTMMYAAPQSPVVVSTTPGATVTGLVGTTIAITFDRPVTMPGALTMKSGAGATLATANTPTTTDNMTFVYTIPAATMQGQPSQTLSFSVVTAGLYETVSGLQLPFQGGNPYVWTSSYDVTKLTTIVFCTNKATGVGAGGIYDTFLKSVYPGATVNFLPSAQYGAASWSAATLNTLQTATLIIMDGNDVPTNANWNTLSNPILSFSDTFLRSAATGMEPITGTQMQSSGGSFWTTDPDPLLFNGVTIGIDGSVAQDTNTGGHNMDILDYLAVGTKQNGITYGTHDNGNFYHPVLQYWPANTTFYAGGTTSAVGRRMYYAIDSSTGGDSVMATNGITPNGIQMVKNVLKWMTAGATTGQPTVASTIPGATALQRLNTVTVQFDRHVTQPGQLTITGSVDGAIATVATPTAGVDGGIRWVYTVPAGAMIGKIAQTLTFSVVMTGVAETESGLQLPYAAATPYTWTSAYNPGNLANIVFLSSRTAAQAVPFTTFMQSVYGPNTTVNFLPKSAWFSYALPFQPYTQSVLQTANVIVYDSGDGITAGSNMDHPQWNALATPLIAMTTPAPKTANWGWATATTNWTVNGITVQPVNQDPLLFQGVNINPANNFITTISGSAPLTNKLDSGKATNNFNGTLYATQSGSYGNWGVPMIYWPANTVFNTEIGKSSAGPRLFFAALSGADGPSGFTNGTITADGLQLFRNVMRFMSWPAGQPQVVSVSPTNGTLLTKAAPSTVVVTFDRPVLGVTNITVNGIPVGNPVASVDNTVYTWTIPTAAQANVICTVNFALIQTGIYESVSGLQLPLGGGTYNWSVTYDKTQFHPIIGLVSNTDSSDDHSAYTSFLVNDVYSTTLYQRVVQIEDIRGKYYNAAGLTAATRSVMEGALSLVIVLPFQTNGQLSVKTQWDLLAVPTMIHKADTAVSWGLGSTAAPFAQWDTWDPITNFGQGAGFPAGQGVAPMQNSPAPTPDPIMNNIMISGQTVWFWGNTGPFQGIVIPNGDATVLSAVKPQYYTTWGWVGNTSQLIGKWEKGAAFNGGGTAPARRFFQTMGAQATTDNYGSAEVANFFANASNPAPLNTGGAPQILRNSLRWLMNPDSLPVTFPLAFKTASPPPGGLSGVYQSPITVTFTKPVSGVLPGDLTWNASTSALTYVATAATPAGSVPTDTWIFDGAWETNTSLIGIFQPINITLNPMDTPTHSHITSADGDGCPATLWTWQYAWLPVPAAVSTKLWTLYE